MISKAYTVHLTARLAERLEDLYQRYTLREGIVSRSQLIRRALCEWIDREDQESCPRGEDDGRHGQCEVSGA